MKRKYTEADYKLVKSLYISGLNIKSIAFRMDRPTSSICYMLEKLASEGKLVRKRHSHRIVDLHVRMSPELYEKVQKEAFVKGMSVSRFVEMSLLRLMP